MLISIITVNYNDAKGLEKTIQSVQSQTYQDFEHIIIDGNSDDGSKEVIKKYKDSFSYWVSEPDTGIYNAMNKGIKVAKGEYLLFLNSGDTLFNINVINDVKKELIGRKDIYYGNIYLNDIVFGKRLHKPSRDLRFSYFVRSSIPHQSTFIKKGLFDKVFYYNENLKIVSDWEFFINAICKYSASYKYMDITVSDFEGGGLTSLEENKILLRKEREQSLIIHFPSFFKDYVEYKKLKKFSKLNRARMLMELEKSKVAQRLNTIVLLFFLIIFRGKKIKDL